MKDRLIILHRSLRPHTDEVSCLCITPDGKFIVSGSWDRSICVINLENGDVIRTWQAHSAWIQGMLCIDNTRVASASRDGTIKVWDIPTGDCIETLRGHSGAVTYLALSEDGGSLFSASEDSSVRKWDLTEGVEVNRVDFEDREIRSLTRIKGQSIIAVGFVGGVVEVYDVEAGNMVTSVLIENEEYLSSLLVSSNSRILFAGGHSGNIWRWNWESEQPEPLPTKHSGTVHSMGFSPEGRFLVTSSRDSKIKIHDLQDDYKCVDTLRANSIVRALAITPDGSSIITGSDEVWIWDWGAFNYLGVLKNEEKKHSVNQVVVVPDQETIFSASSDSRIETWSVKSRKVEYILHGHSKGVTCLSRFGDGERLASGSLDGTVRVWNIDKRSEVRIFNGHDGAVTALCVSTDDSKVISGGQDASIRIWDVDSDQQLMNLSGHNHAVVSLLHLFENLLVSGSRDNTVMIWNLESGECVKVLSAHRNAVSAIAGIPNSDLIVTGSWDKTLKIWQKEDWSEIRSFRGHGDYVSCIATSLEGLTILSGSHDGELKAWDRMTGECLYSIRAHDGRITAVQSIGGGRRTVTAGVDGKIKIWKFPSPLLDFIIHLVNIRQSKGFAEVYGEEILRDLYVIEKEELSQEKELERIREVVTEHFRKKKLDLVDAGKIGYLTLIRILSMRPSLQNLFLSNLRANGLNYWKQVPSLETLLQNDWKISLYYIDEKNEYHPVSQMGEDRLILKDRTETRLRFRLVLEDVNFALAPLIDSINIRIESDRGDAQDLLFTNFVFDEHLGAKCWVSQASFKIDQNYRVESHAMLLIKDTRISYCSSLVPSAIGQDVEEWNKTFTALRTNWQPPGRFEFLVRIGGWLSELGKFFDVSMSKLIALSFIIPIITFILEQPVYPLDEATHLAVFLGGYSFVAIALIIFTLHYSIQRFRSR